MKSRGLVKSGGKQRTDSTHVLASIRSMNRLELVIETMRATLNHLALVDRSWLKEWAPADWADVYGPRADNMRLPKGEEARNKLAQRVGNDGFELLSQLALPEVQSYFATMPEVVTLSQIWERHFDRSAEGKVRWRAGPELSRASSALESPYDTQARYSTKRDIHWTGYRVHLTEVCDSGALPLITHVHTGPATEQDISCTSLIHQALSAKDLLPRKHFVDTGYIDASVLVESLDTYQVELFGPLRTNPSWQSREGGLDKSHFKIDWDKKCAVCPEGKVSSQWTEGLSRRSIQNGILYEHPYTLVTFSDSTCKGCQKRDDCTSAVHRGRRLLLGTQRQEEVTNNLRQSIASPEGKIEYRNRAAIEGTLSQSVRRSGLRRSRYTGLKKTHLQHIHLQHIASASGLNLDRLYHHLTQRKRAQTRISRFETLIRQREV